MTITMHPVIVPDPPLRSFIRSKMLATTHVDTLIAVALITSKVAHAALALNQVHHS